jgi:hypothetical protein
MRGISSAEINRLRSRRPGAPRMLVGDAIGTRPDGYAIVHDVRLVRA